MTASNVEVRTVKGRYPLNYQTT